MEKELIIYQRKSKQIGLSLLGLMMVLASLLSLFLTLSEKRYLIALIGLTGLVFFGFCEIFIIKQIFTGKEIVVLTSEGFFDYSSALATKKMLIRWSDVYKIENKSMLNQQFVSVYLKDSEAFLAKLSNIQRRAIQANLKLGFGEINITLQTAKNCTNPQLIEKMNAYINE